MAHPSRRSFVVGLLLLGGAPFGADRALAQLPESPFRLLGPEKLGPDALNRGGVWTLHFGYIPPRITTLDIPGRGKKTVWYMPYYVYNPEKWEEPAGEVQPSAADPSILPAQPRQIIPEFELKTKDPDGAEMSSLDESEPWVVDQLRKIEDPLGKLNYQTSVSISKGKIPVGKSKWEAYPQSQAVYGIAVWLDVPEKANPNNFSVYVSGLSNGLAKKETLDKEMGETRVQVSRKTLRLDFRRPVAATTNRTDDIKVNDNNGLGAHEWIYRQSSVTTKKTNPDEK